jgi:hypothetical protein
VENYNRRWEAAGGLQNHQYHGNMRGFGDIVMTDGSRSRTTSTTPTCPAGNDHRFWEAAHCLPDRTTTTTYPVENDHRRWEAAAGLQNHQYHGNMRGFGDIVMTDGSRSRTTSTTPTYPAQK